MNAIAMMLLLSAIAQPADVATARAVELRALSIAAEPTADLAGLERPSADVKSPDGRRTARVQPLRPGAESARGRLTIIGPGSRRVSIGEVVNHFGTAWSPDGSKIAYCSGATLHVADSDGRSSHMLRRGGGVHPGACFDLAWSADGRTLSFTEVDNAAQPDLSPPRRITITLGVKNR